MTSNAPSLDRLQHVAEIEPPRVDAATFRQGWRVRTRLDALRSAGRINLEVWQAAVEYRAAYDRWQASGGGELAGRISGGADAHDRMLGLVDTLATLTAVERRIGRLATALCVACVVEDLSWPEIGRRCGRSNHTAEAWTVRALRALARAWATRREGGPDG
jgi:DNA-directed RNA polymerase specialized sigma24 family protein